VSAWENQEVDKAADQQKVDVEKIGLYHRKGRTYLKTPKNIFFQIFEKSLQLLIWGFGENPKWACWRHVIGRSRRPITHFG